MTKEKHPKRFRRQKETMKEIRKALINLILESSPKENGIAFEDIRAVFDKFGLDHLSDPSIRRDLELAGIEYNGLYYVLKGMIPAQKTSLRLSELIKDFDIFGPVGYPRVNSSQTFTPLSLSHIYLRLKIGVRPEQLLEFKELLQQYLNQVHNLYLETPAEYPLERFFFDVTVSNQTICFSLNGKNSLDVFSNLLNEINECNPNKRSKKIKLFHIIPQ
ncbi:MAG: hypothetical protein ACLRZR_03970 [Turicibacter sp.]